MRDLVRLVLEMTRGIESSTELDPPPHLGFAQMRTRARHHHQPHGPISTPTTGAKMLRPNLTRTTTMTVPTQRQRQCQCQQRQRWQRSYKFLGLLVEGGMEVVRNSTSYPRITLEGRALVTLTPNRLGWKFPHSAYCHIIVSELTTRDTI